VHHVVNVDFHDLATRKAYHFQDTNKYEMASVGERGILFACKGGNGQPGRMEYKPYATWASTSEWSFNLPVGEDPITVAAGGFPLTRVLRDIADEDIEGNGVAVVATSKGYIRFFTGGGLQKYIWYLGDDVVTMAAGREWLFMVHREGGTTLDGSSLGSFGDLSAHKYSGCQNLSYTLMALDTFVILQQGRLPLPKSHELKWIGLADEGVSVIFLLNLKENLLENRHHLSMTLLEFFRCWIASDSPPKLVGYLC
jgi:chromosome transmission fidelity protein 4